MRAQTLPLGESRSLHLVTEGRGRDIVLLHGALSTHRDWLGAPLDLLAKLGRVIAVDRPGHGESRRPRLAGSARQQAAQVRDGLHDLGADRPLVVGHSFGGLVALALAEQFPTEVSGLVLVAPLGFPELRAVELALYGPRSVPIAGPALAALASGTIDRPLVEQVHRLMFWPGEPHEDWRRRYDWAAVLAPKAGIANGEEAVAVHPLAPTAWLNVSSISSPVRILAGSKDLVANPAYHAAGLAALLPDAKLELIDGVGHMLHRQCPQRVADAVSDLLEAQGSAAFSPA